MTTLEDPPLKPSPEPTASGGRARTSPLRPIWADLSAAVAAGFVAVTSKLTTLRRWLGWVTPLGLGFMGVGLLGWVAGLLLGWSEFIVVGGACLAALGLAVLLTLGRLTASVTLDAHPQRVVVGESASAALEVVNPTTHRFLPFQVEVPVGEARAEFDIPTLGSGARHEELLSIPTIRRSVITVGPARTVRSDPLGLIVRQASWSDSIDVYVHPQTAALDTLGAGMLRDLEGKSTNDVSPSDVEIHALRDYVPGDDRRHVHWRTSARTGKLMVRQFIDTRRSHLGLVLSESTAEFTGEEEYELAVSVLASLGVRAILDGVDLTVVSGNHVLPAASTQLLLDRVSAIDASDKGPDVIGSAQALARHAPGLTLAVVLVGSRVPWAKRSGAAVQFDADVRTLLVDCDPGGPSGFSASGRTLQLSVGRLADLPRLLSAVVA